MSKAPRPGIDCGIDPKLSDCAACRTTGGCAKHSLFQCENCGQLWSWSVGAADDLPDQCSDCWSQMHCYSAKREAEMRL